MRDEAWFWDIISKAAKSNDKLYLLLHKLNKGELTAFHNFYVKLEPVSKLTEDFGSYADSIIIEVAIDKWGEGTGFLRQNSNK